MSGRQVQASQHFWSSVVRSFRLERGPHGEPSRQDFKDLDYPDICRVFGERWDELPSWQDHPRYRLFIGPGRYGIYSVLGQLEFNSSVTLVRLSVEQYPVDLE